MSFVSKITFYPKIAFRYIYRVLLKVFFTLLNFLTNIGLVIIGFFLGISILSYNKFDQSLNTSSDEISTS